jgi:hypothetical protein
VVGLRSDLNRKDAEITKLTQLDQEKTKLQSELQKQLNDLTSKVLIKEPLAKVFFWGLSTCNK